MEHGIEGAHDRPSMRLFTMAALLSVDAGANPYESIACDQLNEAAGVALEMESSYPPDHVHKGWDGVAADALMSYAMEYGKTALAYYLYHGATAADKLRMLALSGATPYAAELQGPFLDPTLIDVSPDEERGFERARLEIEILSELREYSHTNVPAEKAEHRSRALTLRKRLVGKFPDSTPFKVEMAFVDAGLEDDIIPSWGSDFNLNELGYCIKAAAGKLARAEKNYWLRIQGAGMNRLALNWVNERRKNKDSREPSPLQPDEWRQVHIRDRLAALVPDLLYEAGAHLRLATAHAVNLAVGDIATAGVLYNQMRFPAEHQTEHYDPDMAFSDLELLKASLSMARYFNEHFR